MSRTSNSLRNAGSAIAGQLVTNLLRFACRTVFLRTLGKEYLGISSLYANVITILSITELGFSSAVTFSLYDPLARDDRDAVCALMHFFRNAYRVIAAIMLALGLALMPALPKLMTGVTDKINIYHYYLLYLAQTVVSYLFFSYKSVLLIADQRKYTADLIAYACQILMALVQMAVLLIWKSFLAYTVLQIVCSALQNICTAWVVDRRYPYLRRKAPPLAPRERKDIIRRVYAMSLNKVSTAVGTSTDNLLISGFVSVLAVGLYSNYSMVVQIVQKFISSIFQALTSSLGNLYASGERAHSAFLFRCLNMLNNCLIILCTVCFLTLFQPFVTLWAGKDYLLPYPVVITVALNFATNYLQNVVQIYREACGAFVRGKYRPVATAVLNLGLSLVLVKRMGIAGVLWGSIISRLVTTWWFDAWLLCQTCLGISPRRYYLECGGTLVLSGLCAGVVELLFRSAAVSWPMLLGKGAAAVGLTGLVCLGLTFRTEEFAYLKDALLHFLRRKKA